jgi:hypothetical protein
MHIPCFAARLFARLLPIAIAISGITCAFAAETGKNVKPAVKTAPGKKTKPTGSASMKIEKDSPEGVAAPTTSSVAVTDVAPPVITTTKLSNGLVMVTSSEGFMTTMTVTKSADGKLVYNCADGHPKGAHTHAAGTPAGGEK